ncbi:MAG: DUF1343 domain-containing protein [Bacteroidetes bacterium]|nr:DUF1343 domain-containing protein [Bacteroidota bacterium]MCB9044043.1 DUF1343 domain-containing protein [Chitinophagales bacterium]
MKLYFTLLSIAFCFFLGKISAQNPAQSPYDNAKITLAAERFDMYRHFLVNKKVALVVNHSSYVGDEHLVDFLLHKNVHISKIFAPEHGFRGTADAGEKVSSTIDEATKLPVISLYGSNKKPQAKDLADVDVLIFDIQDVGVRFYTYISTMHYILEAAAENHKKCIVLDRPNPNGFYVDGPVLNKAYTSFVGMHPIPVVHGLTVGELACMINEEAWLNNGVACDLEVIPCLGYTHSSYYELPIAPSPNLPNMKAIYLYPSLCFFEGTNVSVGRGTDFPFQLIGYPNNKNGNYTFTPKPNFGSKHPPFEGEICEGDLLNKLNISQLQNEKGLILSYILQYYRQYANQNKFFLDNLFFDKLAGTDALRKQIIAGKDEESIRQTWQDDLTVYKKLRKKYLIYPDFE